MLELLAATVEIIQCCGCFIKLQNIYILLITQPSALYGWTESLFWKNSAPKTCFSDYIYPPRPPVYGCWPRYLHQSGWSGAALTIIFYIRLRLPYPWSAIRVDLYCDALLLTLTSYHYCAHPQRHGIFLPPVPPGRIGLSAVAGRFCRRWLPWDFV